VIACYELAVQHLEGSSQQKDYLDFEVIPVFNRKTQILVWVSNALNLNLDEKVAKENFQLCTELGRAA